MINKETILSVYDDKLTLFEWVSKVENALNNAVLSSASLVDEGNNDYHFVFVFEDESEIITPSFTMPKQITSAYISSGNLHIVLVDGTDINAGSVGASFGNVAINGTLSVTGSTSIDGALTVGQNPIYGGDTITARGNIESDEGDISAKGQSSYFECDNFIRPVNTLEQIDDTLQISGSLPTSSNGTFSVDFTKIRVSNGKLNIVGMVSFDCTTTISASEGNKFINLYYDLPTSIFSRLYPIRNQNNVAIQRVSSGVVDTITGTYVNTTPFTGVAVVTKGTTRLYVNFNLYSFNGFSAGATYAWRFEFNLIL